MVLNSLLPLEVRFRPGVTNLPNVSTVRVLMIARAHFKGNTLNRSRKLQRMGSRKCGLRIIPDLQFVLRPLNSWNVNEPKVG